MAVTLAEMLAGLTRERRAEVLRRAEELVAERERAPRGAASSLPGAERAPSAGRGFVMPPPPPRILRNVARCNKCGGVIESRHRHDFVSCGCGATSVDGGKDYLKRCFGPDGYTEMSEHEGDGR